LTYTTFHSCSFNLGETAHRSLPDHIGVWFQGRVFFFFFFFFFFFWN
jgi:hypothetical protein